MAKEAIQSVKDAEEQVKKILQEASEASKKFRDQAIVQADSEYKGILQEAEASAKAIKDKAREEGELISKPILEKGKLDTEDILSINEYFTCVFIRDWL